MSHAAALSLLLIAGTAGAQSGFVPGFDDVPLMPGLAAAAEGPMVFDAPGGRIVDVQTAGRANAVRVLAFYRDTLPQLGWRPVGADGTFEREGEVLTLLIDEPARDEVTVRFSLAPAPGGK